jgi:hypothetical protein
MRDANDAVADGLMTTSLCVAPENGWATRIARPAARPPTTAERKISALGRFMLGLRDGVE